MNIELNKIYCSDCIELMKELPDNFVDLIFADIPYESLDFRWLEDGFRVLKSTGSFYLMTDYRSVAQWKLELDKKGIFQNWILWLYRKGTKTKTRFTRSHQDILFYTKNNNYNFNPVEIRTVPRLQQALQKGQADEEGFLLVKHFSPQMKEKQWNQKCNLRVTNCPDWWYIPIVARGNNPETKWGRHPFQKPEKLLERIILASSNENDIVFDPFTGSGTTAVVAKKLGRNYLGCDINQEYLEIANRRLEEILRAYER